MSQITHHFQAVMTESSDVDGIALLFQNIKNEFYCEPPILVCFVVSLEATSIHHL